MKNKVIKILSICLLSGGLISATTVGAIKLTEYYSSKENAKTNPIVTLSAVDKDGAAGEFIIEGVSSSSTSRYVKYGTTWGTFKNNMPVPVKSGFDISGWDYQDGSNWVALTDSYVFKENVTIRVNKWSGASPSHFATDSWQTIVDVAAKGLDNLKYVYSLDIADNNNSFVGKTRDVYIKGIGNFKVRVIGEDCDLIAGETNKVAALTFEFVDIVYPGIGFDSDYNNWSESDLNRFLNDQFIYRLPEPINSPNVLQTVNKKSFEYSNDSSKYVIKDNNQKIFIPSLSELGVTRVNEDDNYDTNLEGNAYSYYLYDSAHLNKFVPSFKQKKYTDNKGKETNLAYWTRSSLARNKTSESKDSFAHYIDENGYVVDDQVNTAKGVSPCFAIGQDTAYTLTVNTNDKLGYKANKTIVKNNNAVIDLYDTDISDEYIAPVNISKIQVKVGNTVLPETEEISSGKFATNYTYDKELNRLVINSSKITDNVTVTVTPYQSSFHNDSWSTFLGYANQGYDKLAKITELGVESGAYINDYNENGGSFVGLTRTVTIGETPYTVRVIGEKHDTTTISDTNRTTTLTFEFVDSIFSTHFDGLSSVYTYNDGEKDVDSELKGAIDNSIGKFPTELQNDDTGIRVSNKKINDTYSKKSQQQFTAKLFPLSISEISTDTTYQTEYGAEGTLYSYYKSNSYLSRLKKSTNCTSYWLRSGSNVDVNNSCIAISQIYGTIEGNLHFKDECAVCPAFAVGIEP